MQQGLVDDADVIMKTKAKYNPNFVYETQEFIVSAISDDFNNVDFSIVGQDLLVFEREDPLGMAFYIFALLETDYISQEFTSKPEDWKYWLETRLENEIPTPYVDTELSALGLIVYALSRKEELPENISSFLTLVDEHFSETSGIYKNYLASVLVGLGVSRLTNNEKTLEKIENYIRNQLENSKKNIFNDPKNLVVTYLWSKETSNKQLSKSIRLEVFDRFEKENYLDRDILYLAYILFEEIGTFNRKERREIKRFIEESLRFIRDYTLENKSHNSAAIMSEYGKDIAFEYNEDVRDIYGYPSKPALSRILLSIGLLIEQKYINSPHLFDGSEQLLRKATAMLAYFVIFFGIGFLVFWGWGTLDFLNDHKTNFQTEELLNYILGFVKIIASTLLLVIALLLVTMALLVPYYLFRSMEINHSEALKKSLSVTKKYAGPAELLFAIAVELLT